MEQVQTFDELVPYTPEMTAAPIIVGGWGDYADTAPTAIRLDFSNLTAAFQHTISVDRAAFIVERASMERQVTLDYSPDDDAPGEDDQDITRNPVWGTKRAIFSPWWFKATKTGFYTTPLKELHWFAWGRDLNVANSKEKPIIERLNDPWALTFWLRCQFYTANAANPAIRPIIEAWRLRGTVTYEWT